MAYRNPLCEQLGIDHPIFLGPLGGGFSTAQLTAEVSNGGGLGSFGAHHLSPETILATAAGIRKLTDRPFALNLWVSKHDEGGLTPDAGALRRVLDLLKPYYAELGLEPAIPATPPTYDFEDQARAVLEARPAMLSFVFGVPSKEIVQLAKRRGILLAGGATTVDEARAVEEAGADMVVASGMEAGGHRPSFLAPAEDSLVGTMALTPQTAARVKIPVVAAGGIADARGVAAALKLGAQAVQVGTAFLACEESNAPPAHREMLFREAARGTVLTRVFTGRLARSIRNRLHDEMAGQERLAYPAQGWLVGAFRSAAIANGRHDLISLWSGQSAGLLEWRRAQQVLRTLAAF